jgi:phosphoglucomutase
MTKQIDILRPNTSLAAVADVALPLAQAQGSAAAARAMRDAGVPDRVTARVLCEPSHRHCPLASSIGARERFD